MNPSNTRTVSHLFQKEQNRRHNQDARKGKGMTSRECRRSASKGKIKKSNNCQGLQ